MKSFEIFVTTAHSAAIDVLQPQVMSESETKADNYEYDVSYIETEERAYEKRKSYRKGKNHHLDNELHLVLNLALATDFFVKGKSLSVIYCHLEKDEIFET